MELLLVRHALPERRELESGRADPGLTHDGRRQSELLADYLASESFDALYTSPLRRAVETAAPIERRLGLTATTVDDVAEWDRNSPEYVPVEQLKADNDPRFHQLLHGGGADDDPMHEFERRVRIAIDQLIAAHPGDRIVVICHGGVINLVLSDVLGLDGRGFFYPNYTSIHRVAASRSGVRSIVTINETSHLRNSGLPMGLFQEG